MSTSTDTTRKSFGICLEPGTNLLLNKLAREQMKHKLLADIMIDLTICDIEGWNKLEYLDELKEMINSIGKG